MRDETADQQATLTIDPRLFRQMLVNLLSDAVKFSPKTGVVKIAANPAADGRLIISVTDEGPGMAAMDIPKSLTPFVQTESGLKAGGGTGLGLSLVKKFMELHGGSLDIQSVVGQGTVVSLCFPASCREA